MTQVACSENSNSSFINIVSKNKSLSINSKASCTTILKLRHLRLRHPFSRVVKTVIEQCDPSVSVDNDIYIPCDACQKGKSYKLLFFLSVVNKATKPLMVVHFHVCGSAPVLSSGGYRWYVAFTDEYTRFMWIYFLKQNSTVKEAFSCSIHRLSCILALILKHLWRRRL